MPGAENHIEVLNDECEKYLAENGMYSLADLKDETNPADIFTIDGKIVAIQVGRDISVHNLMHIINHGREQYAAGLTASGKFVEAYANLDRNSIAKRLAELHQDLEDLVKHLTPKMRTNPFGNEVSRDRMNARSLEDSIGSLQIVVGSHLYKALALLGKYGY